MALGARLKRSKRRFFCLTSDGELDEGSVWEAALFIAHRRLTSVVWLIDRNRIQGIGRTEDVLSLEPLDAKLIERGRKAARGRNVQAMIEADAAFHNAVYVAARNPLIPRSAHLHWAHIRRAMGAVLQASTLRESVWDEHEAIAQAIAAGDADRAERLMREHDERASRHMTRHLDAAMNGAGAQHA